MRVLFVAHGPAHVPWIVPLSWACRLAGHEVRVAARPQCVDLVTRAGLHAVRVGDPAVTGEIAARPLDLAGVRPDGPLPDGWVNGEMPMADEMRIALATKMFHVADAITDDLVAFAEAWRPDIVVYDTGAVAGLVAAQVLGVPAIGHTWGLNLGMFFQREADVLPGYRALFERFGVPALVGPAVWIDPSPPSLRPAHPVRRAEMRFVPYTSPAALPGWVNEPAERPRICLTGGVTISALNTVQDTVITAAGDLGAEVVMAVPDAGVPALRELPAHVRVVESFPLEVLFGGCDAVVHHGGGGSGTIAFHHGLPQLVLPQNPIHGVMGRMVEAGRAGICLDESGQADPDVVGAAVTSLLSEASLRENAGRLSAEMAAMPTPSELVSTVEQCAIAGDLGPFDASLGRVASCV
jgi:UDP:flavonoid glycosyltransferase YjiC (YdhE family)